MKNTSISLNICNFNSIECNRTIKYQNLLNQLFQLKCIYAKYIIIKIKNINYNKNCEHPKHDEYKNQSKNTKKKSKKLTLEKVPKRLIEVLGLNESSEICGMCKYRTDKDPEYLQGKNYKASIPIKINNLL